MKLEGVIHCDGPGCIRHEHVGVDSMAASRLPAGWLTVVEHGDFTDTRHGFCGWDCLMKRAAQVEAPEVLDTA